jgi:beta-lactamase superfamily II metal-dependent hydrolase
VIPPSPSPSRRTFLRGLLALPFSGAAPATPRTLETTDREGTPLAPWQWGQLDIHHISTGRGDSTLIVAPDGTTLMIDAGAMYAHGPFNLDLKPNDTRRPGEWIARYTARHLRATKRSTLDYLIVTHIHPDHIGDVDPSLPRASTGDYQLTGVTDVAAQLPIGLLLDRGAPDYTNVELRTAPFAQNYIRFVQTRLAAGARVERLHAGVNNQIRLVKAAAAFATFDVRNIAVNGDVWTGHRDESRQLFPAPPALKPDDAPDENTYSAAFRLTYGKFAYFAAGDLTSNTLDGDLPWRDVESRAAEVAGPVDVAVAAHHGLSDSTGADVVRALRPRIWLIDAWHVSHPSITTLERLFSQRLYPGQRDVFATGLSAANALVNERLTKRFSSATGHVVIRVSPGGACYRVVVTDNSDESDRVVRVFGPIESTQSHPQSPAPPPHPTDVTQPSHQ